MSSYYVFILFWEHGLFLLFLQSKMKVFHDIMQALFRKIAAALPGMETLSSTKQEDMVDVSLKSTSSAPQSQPQGSGCAC